MDGSCFGSPTTTILLTPGKLQAMKNSANMNENDYNGFVSDNYKCFFGLDQNKNSSSPSGHCPASSKNINSRSADF